jgi:hypothetical protein
MLAIEAVCISTGKTGILGGIEKIVVALALGPVDCLRAFDAPLSARVEVI